ncbi:MFS transporter [Rosenbergiella nectarea]|uniref:MFS transporter n=1 Tax=Rosenbergiella nectarea TaxID=988801 RepID=UPI001F4F259A
MNIFKNATSIKLVATEAFSTLSSQLYFFVIPLIAITTMNATTSDVGYINTAMGLGTFIFLLLLGPLCDIRKTHLLLSLISVLRFFILLFTAYLLATKKLDILFVCVSVFFVAGISAIYESTISSYSEKIIDKDKLHNINSWMGGLRTIADVATGTISGLLLSVSNGYLTIIIISIFFFLSALGPLSFHKKINEKNNERGLENLKVEFNDLFHGMRIILSDKSHKSINLSIIQFNLFTSIMFSTYIIYCIKVGSMTVLDVGFAGSIGGIVGLIGIPMSNFISKKIDFKKIMMVTLFSPGVIGCLIFFIPRSDQLVKMILLGLVLGLWSITILINISAFETFKQKTISYESIGRYSAASRCITWGIEPVGALLVAFFSPYMPLNIILIISLIGIAFSPIWIFLSNVPKKLLIHI